MKRRKKIMIVLQNPYERGETPWNGWDLNRWKTEFLSSRTGKRIHYLCDGYSFRITNADTTLKNYNAQCPSKLQLCEKKDKELQAGVDSGMRKYCS